VVNRTQFARVTCSPLSPLFSLPPPTYQKSTNTYHSAANLTLLKQYQFFPDLSNPTNTALALSLALMRLGPNNEGNVGLDFSNFLHIIPEATLSMTPICGVVIMAELLETCKFKDFWAAYEAEPFVQKIPAFADQIRKFVSSVLSLTFQSAPLSLIKQYLNLSTDAEVAAYVKASDYYVAVDGEVIKFVLNESNQPVKKAVKGA
jgi:translation initiation factor 3 subunit K